MFTGVERFEQIAHQRTVNRFADLSAGLTYLDVLEPTFHGLKREHLPLNLSRDAGGANNIARGSKVQHSYALENGI